MKNDPVKKRESLATLGLSVLASFELDSILRFRSIAVCAVLASMATLPAAAQSREEQIGAEMAQKVEEEIGIYRTPLTSDYVEAIGSRLVGTIEIAIIVRVGIQGIGMGSDFGGIR